MYSLIETESRITMYGQTAIFSQGKREKKIKESFPKKNKIAERAEKNFIAVVRRPTKTSFQDF